MTRSGARRMNRHRTVFISPVPMVWIDEPSDDATSSVGGAGSGRLRNGLVHLTGQKPFSPLAMTVVRPIGDAVTAAQTLRMGWQ